MSQQGLDLRRSFLIIRRHRLLVGIVAGVGLLIGAAYGELKPPAVSSTAIVALPPATSNTPTEVVIADSDPVLSAAAVKLSPALSLDKIRSEVQIKSLTQSIISITAKGKTARDAEDAANAVAESYISYIGSKKSPVGHVVATIVQPATPNASSKLRALLITALIGALAGAVLGLLVSIAVGRKDRRLRERDQIAKSIGIPVLASVPVAHPSDAQGWAKLLADYKPPAVYAWQLRTAMDQLGITGRGPGQSRHASDGLLPDGDRDAGGVSVAVVSLSSDPGAVALGPQLAAFAASLGIRTALAIGPQQDTKTAATLRAACNGTASASSDLPRSLRLLVSDDGRADGYPGAALTVVVVVVDASAPKMPDTMRTAAAVIGVSAGKATAEQLARAAMVAAADGREISGILVADPEPTDQTTGRVPHLARPASHRLPNRLRGVVTETRR
jgi:hypothetical protein